MTLASDIRDRIKSDLILGGSDYDTQILGAIQTALRQLRGKRYWFLKTTGTLSLVAASNSVTLPSDYSAPDTFSLIVSGTRLTDGKGFDFLTYERLQRDYWTTSPIPTGASVACAVLNNTLYTSHTSVIAYSLPITYYKQDITLPTATQTSVWFDDGYDVVRSLAQFIFMRDAQGATAAEQSGDMAAIQLQTLNTTHENRYEGRS